LAEAYAELPSNFKTKLLKGKAEKEGHTRQMEELQKAREADKEHLRQEFISMLAAQRQDHHHR